MNYKVRVALVIIEDDIDLRVHPVVHTRVKKVTGGVTGVDGRRPPHGGVSSSKPRQRHKKEEVSVSGAVQIDSSKHSTFVRS